MTKPKAAPRARYTLEFKQEAVRRKRLANRPLTSGQAA